MILRSGHETQDQLVYRFHRVIQSWPQLFSICFCAQMRKKLGRKPYCDRHMISPQHSHGLHTFIHSMWDSVSRSLHSPSNESQKLEENEMRVCFVVKYWPWTYRELHWISERRLYQLHFCPSFASLRGVKSLRKKQIVETSCPKCSNGIII